jgi:SPP1 family predicted phage head-tail adaptor
VAVKVVPNVKAGTLNRRVTLQTPSDTTDADTQADTDADIVWTPFATVWAAVEPLSGTAIGAPSANLEGVVSHLVRLRYLPGVLNGMRVHEALTGLDLDVLAVIDINEAHRQLHLECVARRYPPV